MAGPLSILRKASVTGSRRGTPIKPVVQAGLDGVLVIAEADGGNNTAGAGEESVPRAEVVVLVFDLARPVLGEHVFETTAHGVAIAATAVVGEGAAAEAAARQSGWKCSVNQDERASRGS